MTPLEYWRSGAGLGNITPFGKTWPEGRDFGPWLAGFIGQGKVLEFGCGIGRLARLFPAERYVGVDVCGRALDVARAALPSYDFRDAREALPDADVTLAHTVLLHVPDDDLPAILARFASSRIVISEILGRRWRRAGNPPVFNREIGDYEAALPAHRLMRLAHRLYPHYPDTFLTVMEFAS